MNANPKRGQTTAPASCSTSSGARPSARLLGRTWLAAIVACAVVGCSSTATPDRDTQGGERAGGGKDIHPKSFVASIGGFLGASYRVELQADGSLLYLRNPRTFTSAPGTEKIKVEVPAAGWQAFRGALDAAEVWEWKKDYIDPKVCDGTQWILEIEYADASVASRGSNAYPSKDSFDRFLKAVAALLGGRTFH